MKVKIKKIAHAMMREKGLINLSRLDLCHRAGIPEGSFTQVMGQTFSELINEMKEKNNDKPHPVSKLRTDPGLRRIQLLNIIMMLATKNGYHRITRDDIALAANVSNGLISHYFGSMNEVRNLIMFTGIKNENLTIIAQGIAQGDPKTKHINPSLKTNALKIIGKW